MNKKGQFGLFITLVLILLIMFVWVTLVPVAVEPGITDSIEASAGEEGGEGVEFFARMYPWAVPAIIVIGLVGLGLRS